MNDKVEQKPEQPEEPSAADLAKQLADAQALIEQAAKDNNSMKTQMDILLGEKKKAAQREAEARAEAQANLEKNGDFEQLYKSSMTENEKLKADLGGLTGKIATSNINQTAQKLAVELAGDSAPVLMPHLKSRLKYTDDAVKVLDKEGNLTINTLDELMNEFRSDKSFSAVLKGNQASGGGANGSGQGGGASQQYKTRAEFDLLNAVQKAKFMKDGGKLTV